MYLHPVTLTWDASSIQTWSFLSPSVRNSGSKDDLNRSDLCV